VDVDVDLEALGRVGRALADASRRCLLVGILDGCPYPAELAARFGMTKANVSNHLACLRSCGLVVATPEGRRMRYELADERLARALWELSNLVLLVEDDGCTR
jgi:ArsR family transcriptional regulator, cadmium/lead-responsive transcriptional repressor